MRNLKLLLLILFVAAVEARAEMRMLRPVPSQLEAEERAALTRKAAALLGNGHVLCANYSSFLNSCQGVDSLACRQRYKEINDELGAFNNAADEYNAEVVTAMQGLVARRQAEVRGDQQAIRQLGINRTADEYDAWSDWLKNADEERQRQVEEAFKEAAKTLASEALDKAFDAGVDQFERFGPRSAKQAVSKLEQLGADNPDLLDAITALGNAKNKAQKAEAARRVYEGLKRGKEIWDLHDLDADNDSQFWKVGDELIENFVPDKRMKLIGKLTLNEVRATFYTVNEAAFDMPVFNKRIGQLNQLTAAQFIALRSLSTRLVKDVRARNEASRELNGLDQQPAMDVCQMPGNPAGVPVAVNCVPIHRPGSVDASAY